MTRHRMMNLMLMLNSNADAANSDRQNQMDKMMNNVHINMLHTPRKKIKPQDWEHLITSAGQQKYERNRFGNAKQTIMWYGIGRLII